jgi:hypothetical protein
MSAEINKTTFPAWSVTEKFLFRLFAIYFLIQALPLDPQFFNQLFSLTHKLDYNDIFNLAHYSPRFIAGEDSFINWIIVFVLALAGAAIWSYADTTSKEYNRLYYWIRVVVRYRLAIGIIAYGFIKFFPVQSPWPSLSNLNTIYGDFNRWKLFSISLGIVPDYQSFLGLVEITTGILLLFRRTATIGAFIIVIFTGNVFMSNLAYEGGEYVYSLYLISFATFLLVFDLQRIIRLLIQQKPTMPNRFRPSFEFKWAFYARLALKTFVIFFFVLLYGFKTRSGSQNGLTLYPVAKGLKGATGLYNVSEFRLNNNTIPYSKTDPIRWQDVVFEEWNTISIKSNRPVILDTVNTTFISDNDRDRLYELQGSGGRHYYSYQVDTVNHVLTLQNRNKNYNGDVWSLRYEKQGDNTFVLHGVNQQKDSVYAVLDKINKKYLLEEAAKSGRRKGLKL